MKRIIFLFQNIWKQIIYNKFLSVVMLVTMVIGIFFPLMALNDMNDLLADSRMSTSVDVSHIAIIDYIMNYKEEAEMYAAINSCMEKKLFDMAGFCAFERQIIYADKEFYSGGVCGISAEYLDLNAYELLSGEMFSGKDYVGDGEKVCLIGHQSRLAKNGVKTSDTIQILGDTYRVQGVIRAPRVYGGIFVPYNMTSELFSGTNGRIQYQIITYSEDESYPKILSFKLFPGEDNISAQTGLEQEKVYYESIQAVNQYRIFRAALVIGFAIINWFIILFGKIISERYQMAVRMAVGASNIIVGVEVILGNLSLMLIAFLFDVLLYSRVAGLIKGAVIYLQPVTILQVGVGGLLIGVLTGSVSYCLSLRKQGIAILLKRQA